MSDHKSALLRKIEGRSAVTAVIGLGYVGLPLAMELCEAGFPVIGYDVSARVVGLLMRGESHIQDVPAAQVAKHVKSGKFTATTDASALRSADSISIAVPTPLAKTRDPDMSYVVQAVEAVRKHLKKGQLVSLESTTYPGTTDELVTASRQGFRTRVPWASSAPARLSARSAPDLRTTRSYRPPRLPRSVRW